MYKKSGVFKKKIIVNQIFKIDAPKRYFSKVKI